MNDGNLLNTLSSETESETRTDENVSIASESSVPEVALEFQRKKIERLNEEIEDLKLDRKQRKIFSFCIFGFMCMYMAASIVIVFLCGFGCMNLEMSVLITLLTTTLANVIGVFNFVAKYLFHRECKLE